MNRKISLLGMALLVCYLLLFVQLNRVQVLQAGDLRDHPENFRNIERDFDRPRGLVLSSDGVVLARTISTPGGAFERLRQYPELDLFAHIVGYLSLEFGAEGVERAYNDLLAGQTPEQQYAELSDLFIERDRTADITLTLRRDLQDAARTALGERHGSVVLLDPRSGGLLASWSWPSYDPNPLSSHDLAGARASREALLADPRQPLLARSYAERFFPGSSFKVVTGGVGVDNGLVTPTEPVYPSSSAYVPPATQTPIGNFGGSSCGGALIEILRVSCNTAFAQMGAETIGPELMVDGAADFGFNARPPFDLPGAAASTFPTDYGALLDGPGGPGSVYEDSAKLAQASIGQNDVQASPLAMALVAAALSGDGSVPVPRVLAEARDAEGEVLEQPGRETWREAVSPEAAATMRQAMEAVVADGTARGLQTEGWTIGAKTGTAEISSELAEANAWVVGYGGPSGQPPVVAFAVLVEADAVNAEQTGGSAAVPVAKELLDVLRGVTGGA
ncbi:MAG: hypothetical protein GEV08_00010 [Acidimicrobiia bacterium]|nr:hypothetical protein [Acidimicrobiia bacterium]